MGTHRLKGRLPAAALLVLCSIVANLVTGQALPVQQEDADSDMMMTSNGLLFSRRDVMRRLLETQTVGNCCCARLVAAANSAGRNSLVQTDVMLLPAQTDLRWFKQEKQQHPLASTLPAKLCHACLLRTHAARLPTFMLTGQHPVHKPWCC